MDRQVTLAIPESLYKRAERLADLTGKNVNDILSSTLMRSIPPLTDELDTTPVELLSDEALLSVADGMMDDTLQNRMSQLQQAQQSNTLSDEERAELQMLMEIYDVGQLHKTQALVEATRRGLRKPGTR